MNSLIRNLVFWSLFGIGLIIVIVGGCAIAFDFVELGTDIVLYGGAFTFSILAILSVFLGVVVMGAISDPKTLIKLVAGVIGIILIVGTAWLISKPWADPVQPMGYLGEAVSASQIRLTDVMLNLTWILLGGTAVALVIYIINLFIGAISK